MKTRTGRLALALTLIAVAALQTWTARADEPVPCERRLPKNVLGYVSLRNLSDFKAGWDKTLYGQLGRDDSLGDFRADLQKHIDDVSRQIEGEIGLGLSELLAIPHGELALAMLPLPEGKLVGDPPRPLKALGFVMLLDFGQRRDSVDKLLEKVAEELERQHARRNEDEIDDTRIVSFETEDADGDKEADGDDDSPIHVPSSFSYFLKDTFLVVGNDPAALKEVLSRWDGKQEQSLSDHEVFRYIVDRCRDGDAPPQLAWFIDPIGAVQAFTTLGPHAAPIVDEGLATLRNLGIDKFRGAGGTFEMAHGDYDMVSRTLIYIEPPAKGILELLQFGSSAQSPPKWLSSEWTGFTSVNWSLSRAYGAIEAMVDLRQGPGATARTVEILAANEAFGKIHLKRDICDQFSGTIHIAEDESLSGEGTTTGYLVAAGIKNPVAFSATLSKLARLGQGALKINQREFQGETIYEIEGRVGVRFEEPDEDDIPSAQHIGVAVAENHLMVATDVRLLERVLRGIGDRETLADSPSYARIARKFPAQTASIGYARQDVQLKVLYDLFRSGQAGPMLGLDKFDFSTLPAFDALKKYIPESGSFMEQDERGLRITSFSLRKDTD